LRRSVKQPTIALLSNASIRQEKRFRIDSIHQANRNHQGCQVLQTFDLSQFNQKRGPWFWQKDSYIFIQDCDKKVIVAHPVKPESIGQNFMTMKDSKGNLLFVKDYCEKSQKTCGYLVSVLVAEAGRFAFQGVGTPAPIFPTQHLVVKGFYRYVRNPMYVAVVSVILGKPCS
jgi:hypothetical protein